jgi:hypothetical protein
MKNQLTVLAFLVFIFMNTSYAQIIREVPTTYATIQAAIDAASAGDVVNVAAGSYSETLIISKAIILKGANYGVDARGTRGAESIISSSNTSGSIQIGPVSGTVVIDGFTFSGGPHKAIHVTGVTTNVIIKNNIIEVTTADGINLFQAQNAVVEYNWVKGAAVSGITAGYDNGTISELDGVITSAKIRYNKIDDAAYGITGYQNGSVIVNNEVTGNGTIAAPCAGIGGQFYNTTISGNTVCGYTNGAGIAFNNPTAFRADSHDISATFNNVYGNLVGIYINQPLAGNNITVNYNNIAGNITYGAAYDTGGSGTLNAENNWWGNASGPGGVGPGTGDVVTTTDIDYTPWITAFTLYSPFDTITGIPIRPELCWVGGTGTYTVKIATSAAGLATATAIYTGTNLSYTLTEAQKLNNNTKYYWQVTDGGATTVGPWSFTTVPKTNVYNSNPYSGATSVEFNPCTFGWYTGTDVGSLNFTLQYAKSTSAPNWLTVFKTDVDNSNNLTYDATLDPGTKYYWRVVVKDADDFVIAYSNNFYFTTKSGSYKPYLSYPVYGMPVYEDGLTFNWYIGTYDLTNLSFEVKIYDGVPGNPGTSQVGTTYTTTDLSADLADMGINLDAGSIYYWTVTCIYNNSTTDKQTSTAGSFKIQDNSLAVKPYLSYPVSNVTVYTTTPTFYWYTGTYAEGLKFDFYIAKFGDPYPGSATEADIEDYYFEYNGTPLEAGVTYKWKIEAKGSGGSSETSTDGKFTVASTLAYGIPIASWPLGNPTYYSGDVTLTWYISGATSGIDYYQIYYSTTEPNWSTLSTATATVSDPDVLNLDVSGLTDGTYYWGVRAHYITSTYSAWYHSNTRFTIDNTTSTVGVPYVVAPTGGITIYNTYTTLYWYVIGDATSIDLYKIKWSRTSNWSLSDSTTASDQTVDISNLVPGATYWWKVYASTNGGTSWGTASNPVGRFVVAPSATSSIVPIVGSPVNYTPINSTAAMLSWFTPSKTETQLKYNLEYSADEDFNNSIIVPDISNQSYNLDGLKNNTTYFWRVTSKTPEGETSGYSNIGSFKVEDGLTPVQTDFILPDKFDLEQNYPNPFNPVTRITYTIPENSFVSLKIYDMLGREVKTLVNQNMNAGRISVDWNGDDNSGVKVSSGVYIYKITAGSFVSSKKMMLLK